MTETDASTIVCLRERPDAVLRLVCCPHAGGSAQAFRDWAEELPEEVEVHAVGLPGRGARLDEPPLRSINGMAKSVAWDLRALTAKPLAFFGHSMGALVSFETTRLLRRAWGFQPAALTVSGHRAPHLPRRSDPIHALPREEFRAEIKAMNGTPSEAEELVELLLPTFRADFQACDTYRYSAQGPLDCPIVALAGDSDPRATVDEVTAWEEHSRVGATVHVLRGDHFFVYEPDSGALDVISAQMQELVSSLRSARGAWGGSRAQA